MGVKHFLSLHFSKHSYPLTRCYYLLFIFMNSFLYILKKKHYKYTWKFGTVEHIEDKLI